MKISTQWTQSLANTDLMPEGGVDELVRKIGAQLGEVDETIDLSVRYQSIVVAKVVSCDKHPNADKLHVCTIDDGGAAKDVARDDNGHVQVVCGAPNVREGLLVAWLPPGTTVPSTFDKEPFVLGARELRGVMSNGMLASAQELAIGDDHSGIVELSEGTPGASFAEVFKLNDHIIDVENKMFTHRPDCFGQLGVARELAGIQGKAFKSPEWYLQFDGSSLRPQGEALPFEVKNELPELVPRFTAIALSNSTVKPSPFWLQTYLARVGIRPINNVVDLTNYYMMLTGQPLHAYDYDKLKALDGTGKATLVVRYPKEGEQLTLLSGKQITPRKEAIMIASASKLIGVGGVMGGSETEVDEHTTNIMLECASFDLYSIRKTSMEHGLFTDAVTRFSKGQSPLQNDRVLAKAVADIRELAGGTVAGDLVDHQHEVSAPAPVQLSAAFINARLGLALQPGDIARLLTNVEFAVEVQGDNLTVQVPFWRTDIDIPEDVVEEVGRLYGYDHLPLELPKRDLMPAPRDPMLTLKAKLRDVLSSAGANELLTYSFVHGKLFAKAGQQQDLAFQLSNALSPDLQYYRLSLTPSLLEKVHPNLKADYVRSDDNEFVLFELNKVHNKQEQTSDDGLPKELHNLALVVAADAKTAQRKYSGAPYYHARNYLVHLLKTWDRLGFVRFVPLHQADLYDNQWAIQLAAPFEPQRAAALMDDKGMVWGVVGEYKRSVQKAFKLPEYAAGFEVDTTLFMHGAGVAYVPLSKFPRTQQDISFKVAGGVAYQQAHDVVQQELGKAQAEHGYDYTLGPVDIYQAEADAAHRTITLRIWLSHPERTLTTEEVNKLLTRIADTAKQTVQAERV